MTEKKSYIPSRLKNASVGGHVAGAADIIDDALNKTQEEINGIVLTPSTGIDDRLKTIENGVRFEGTIQTEGNPANVVSQGAKVTTANAVRGAIDVRTGYFECATAGSTARKDVLAAGFVLTTGGHIKVKMTSANTANNATMNISPTSTIVSANTKTLYYNGEPASASNSWEEGETISVYYDGTYYQASNAQGGGGKAEKIKYDNSQSGLAADNLQGALDELENNIGDISQKTDIGFSVIDNSAYEITNGKITVKNTSASMYRRIEPIDVTNYVKVGARFYLLANYATVSAFTDAEDNVIGDKLVNTTENYIEYSVPEGATKLYVCGRKQTSGNVDTVNLSVYGKVAQSVEETLTTLGGNISDLSGNIFYQRIEVAAGNTHNGYFINNATYGAVWMYSTSYTRNHCMVERTEDMKNVIMTRANNHAARVAFLKTYSAVTSNLQPLDLCDGFQLSDGIIPEDSEHSTKSFIIPDDCNYIVFDLIYQQNADVLRDETPVNFLIGKTGNIKLWEYEDVDIHTLTQYEGYPAQDGRFNDGLPMYIPSNNSNIRKHIAIEVVEGEKYAIEASDVTINVAFASENNTNPSSYENLGSVDKFVAQFKGSTFLTVPTGAHYMIIGSSITNFGDRINSIKSIRKYKEDSLLDVVSKNSTFSILVAASDSEQVDKRKADIVCNGENDAAIISYLMQTYGRRHDIVLASGTYYINSFSGGGDGTVGVPYVAIPLTESELIGYTVKITGKYRSVYGTTLMLNNKPDIRGVRFVVTQECYDSLDNNKYYAVFGGIGGTRNVWSKYQLVLEDVEIHLPDNKKNIICVDGINLGGMDLYHCVFRGNAFNNRHPTEQQPLEIGVEGCIGVRGHRGACNGLAARWEYCSAISLGVGFSVCGEHLVLTRCGGIGNKYSLWFNQFPDLRNDEDAHGQGDAITGKSWMYPIVLIQPMCECSANYIRFGPNPQKQGLDIIGLNVEHHNEIFNSAGNGHLATEDVPGSWAGNISYVIGHNLNNDYPSRPNKYRNMWEYPLFANDGSGKNFNSKNEAHALTGTTATRLTYAANWWQRYWDTDLGKEVICIDPTTSPQTWALADGTII